LRLAIYKRKRMIESRRVMQLLAEEEVWKIKEKDLCNQ
jgi:hypothetical protein